MLYRGKYYIDDSSIILGKIDWKSTGCGAFVIGECGGKKYFIKRETGSLRYPPATALPAPIRQDMIENANWMMDKQKDIKRLFGSLTMEKNHIVVEEEHYWEDKHFHIITPLVPNKATVDFSTINQAQFVKLCLDITELIRLVHNAGVIHCDLKIDNIFIQQNGSELVPYLIDFDLSFPADYPKRKRASGKTMITFPAPHTPMYESPEIVTYNEEEEDDSHPETITEKTDIFSLAMIFHNLWTGQFPLIVGDKCSVGVALFLDKEVKFDSKFDFVIGSKNSTKFSSLLKWMILKDASKRPTAEEVKQVLLDALEVDDEISGDAFASVIETEPHIIHINAIDICTKEELKALGVRHLEKIIQGGQYKYYVKLKGGIEKTLTVDELIKEGYAKIKAISLCPLWPDDDLKFEYKDNDVLTALGIVTIEQRKVGPQKFYFVQYRDGRTDTPAGRGLFDRGIVKDKAIVPVIDEPWPEHGSEFNIERLMSRGVASVSQHVQGGEHYYKIIKIDGTEQIVPPSYMKLMNFVKK